MLQLSEKQEEIALKAGNLVITRRKGYSLFDGLPILLAYSSLVQLNDIRLVNDNDNNEDSHKKREDYYKSHIFYSIVRPLARIYFLSHNINKNTVEDLATFIEENTISIS